MGKIETVTRVKKEALCDQMIIKIDFNYRGGSRTDGIENVLRDCETFLSVLKEDGFPIEKIELADTDISENRYEKKPTFTVSRVLKFKGPVDLPLQNRMLLILQKHRLQADLDTTYRLTSSEACELELLEKAVRISKKRAETAALISGQTVTDISKLVEDRSGSYVMQEDLDEDEEMCAEDGCFAARQSLPASTGLSSPKTTLEKEIYIVWNIE